MKKLKSIFAALMATTMVLTLAGCDEETPDNTDGSSVTSVDRKDMEDEDVTAAAKALADKVSYPDLKVTKRIKWMAWWDMDETAGEAELFKEVYGIPETGDDPSAEGRIFEFSLVDYGGRYDSLSTAIASDDSPDIFPFEITDFPYGVLMNRYQAVDDIVNFSEEKWAKTKDLNDQFMLNGKHYTAFWGISLADLMWYKRSNIESIGKDDPQELFKQGKWDWDAFLDIARAWQQSGSSDNPRYATDGYQVEGSLVVSTGKPIIGTDGTKLISNLRSAEVERAITGIVATLQKEELRYPRHELNNWNTNTRAWANDQVLFFCEGTWRYEEELQKFGVASGWPANDIMFVPYPKDPNADKYYVQIKVDVPMWVKGSQNPEGVQAWYDCCVTTAQDKTLHEASNAKMIKNPKQNYTQEILDFLDELYGYNGESPVVPIVEFRTGLGPNVNDGNMESPVNAIVSQVYILGDSFVQLRDEHESAILSAMEDINDRI